MAELVDALDLGPSNLGCESSSLSTRMLAKFENLIMIGNSNKN